MSRPSFLLALLAALGMLAAAAPVRAAGAPALTGIEAGPWQKADAVVRVRVQKVIDVRAPGGGPGRQVVHAKTSHVFKGPVTKDAVITLMVVGQRPTLDPSQPSVPYFHRERESEHILFLGRAEDRHAWQLQTLFDLDGRGAGERVQVVQLVASWSTIADVEVKAARVVKDLLRLLTSGGAWSKSLAAREIAWLARRRPQSFDKKSRTTLRRVAPMATSRDQRYFTRQALDALTNSGGRAAGAAEEDPWRRAFLAAASQETRIKLLTRVLTSDGPLYKRNAWWAWRRLEPTLRTWFLDALVQARKREAGRALRQAYAGEEDGEVRERIVRALGFLGGTADVPWLAERTRNERLRRAALLALARIGTPEARGVLERATRAPWAGEDLKAWIEHLLSPAFAEGRKRRGG